MTEDPFTGRLRSEPLASLRALREALREEERQVSYWRRLVQGRLDLARTALAGGEPTAEFLAISAATRERAGDARARRSPAFTGSLHTTGAAASGSPPPAPVGKRSGGLRSEASATASGDPGEPSGSPPVNNLGRLWETPMPWDDPERLRVMADALTEAEAALSLYRRTLHRRIDACTAELVGRYQRDPRQLDRIVP